MLSIKFSVGRDGSLKGLANVRDRTTRRVNLYTTELGRCLGVISFTLRKALEVVVFHRVTNLTDCSIRCWIADRLCAG